MKTLTSTILFTVFVTMRGVEGFSQTPNWAWVHNGEGSDYSDDVAYSAATDALGNVYVVGGFSSSSISFGSASLSSSNWFDVFFVKYSPSGNVMWAKSAGGSGMDAAYSIARDASGNFFMTGTFSSSSITFGSNTLNNSGNGGDIFLVKFDANGNILSAKNFGGAGDDIAKSVAVDASGNIYLAGSFSSSALSFGSASLTNNGSDDIFIAKLDAGFNGVWAKSAGGNLDEQAASVAVDASGNIYMAGAFKSSSFNIGSSNLTNAGNYDAFIAKYDANGNPVWAQGGGGSDEDKAASVACDASGNIFIAGYIENFSIDFGSITVQPHGWFTMFFFKLNGSGNAVWGHGVGGSDENYATSITTDISGNVYAAGYFSGQPIVFGNDSLFPTSYDVAVLKYDNAGNEIWAKGAGGMDNDDAFAVAVDDFGNVFSAGGFWSSSIDFGSITLSNNHPSSADVFVCKIGSNATAIDENNSLQEINIYPNPNCGQFVIASETKQSQIEIYNALGEKVFFKSLNNKQETINLNEAGIYFLKVKTENGIINKKIITAVQK